MYEGSPRIGVCCLCQDTLSFVFIGRVLPTAEVFKGAYSGFSKGVFFETMDHRFGRASKMLCGVRCAFGVFSPISTAHITRDAPSFCEGLLTIDASGGCAKGKRACTVTSGAVDGAFWSRPLPQRHTHSTLPEGQPERR